MTKAPLEKYFNPRKCVCLREGDRLENDSDDIFMIQGCVQEFRSRTFYFIIKLDSWNGSIITRNANFKVGERVKAFGLIRINWIPDFRVNEAFEIGFNAIKIIKLS